MEEQWFFMDKFDRIQQIHRVLRNHRYPVPIATLMEQLECSNRTIRRNIKTMQDQLNAPIEYSHKYRGWHYTDDEDNRFELPGLWLTASELQSLSLLLNLLDSLGPSLLKTELNPVEREIDKLLSARGIKPSAFRNLIKILPIANRQLPSHTFQTVSEALLNEQQLTIQYKSYNHSKTERCISPQALIYYRENWYLDAWCHLRKELRTFSLARIVQLTLVKEKRKDVTETKRQAHFAETYGIFSGQAKHTATLRFLPEIAREIAQQQWHPKQQSEWQGKDYLLSIPYADDRELILDILRYSPNVFVESPVALRKKVQNKLQSALGIFVGKRIYV